ncbi:hypothetical protein ACQKWADRAFT_294890 [Trichoderma austrokoningii]
MSPAVGGWATQIFGPSSLGGWCVAGAASDSRQSAPSPSGPAAAGRALGDLLDVRRMQ